MSSHQPPHVVSDADQVAWDEQADVVVVGFGGAGGVAALDAAERGLDVIAVDRFAGGGATAYSGGIVYAGGTRFQREAGYEDDPEEMFRYLSQEWGASVREDTLRRYCETMGGNVHWLADHGVPFDSTTYEEKTIFPPDGYFLYYAGNEKLSPYRDHARPSPRGHRAVGGDFSGDVLFARLKEAALRQGVQLRPHCPVTRLVMDGDDVVGVEVCELPQSAHAEHDRVFAKLHPAKPFNGDKADGFAEEATKLEDRVGGRTRLIRARRGVVLATGGYNYDRELLREHNPFIAERATSIVRMGSMGCDGSGIRLGQSAGGALDRMEKVFLGRVIAPPGALIHGLAVNRGGERFINEESYLGFLGTAISEQPDGEAWLIVDSRTLRMSIRQALTGGRPAFMKFGAPAILNVLFGKSKRAGTLEALGRKVGLDPATFAATVDEFNRGAQTGDDRYGKSRAKLRPLRNGPFWAVNLSTANKFSFTMFFTLGGLDVDDDTGLVLRPDGAPVSGLYAAGRVATGLCVSNYLSGTSIGDCIFAARRAVAHIAGTASAEADVVRTTPSATAVSQ